MPKLDWGNAAAGALTGAAAGSTFAPGVGTAIGGLSGGLLGLFSSKKTKKKSTLDKNQKKLQEQYSQGLSGTGPFADLFNFDPKQTTDTFNKMYADPAYQNFQENIIPSITGQFRGGNLQNSSYLGGALGKAGTDVQNNLNAHLSQMLQQGQESSINRRLSALQNILGNSTFAYEKQQPSGVDNLIGGFASGAGQAGANKFADWLNQSNQSTQTATATS